MSSHGAPKSETRILDVRDIGSGSATSSSSKIARSHSQLTHGRSVTRSSGTTLHGSKQRPEEPAQKGLQLSQTKMPALSHSPSSSTKTRANSANARLAPSYAGRSPPLQSMRFASVPIPVPEIDLVSTRAHAEREPRNASKRLQAKQATTTTLNTDLLGRAPPPLEIPPALIPELQALAAVNPPLVRPLQAPSASLSSIGSPSTQLTSATSIWSASATTTPVSWSSASPSVAFSSSGSMIGRKANPSPAAAQTKSPPARPPPSLKGARRSSIPASVTSQPELVTTPSTRSRAGKTIPVVAHARVQERHQNDIPTLWRETVDRHKPAAVEGRNADHVLPSWEDTTSLTALPSTTTHNEEEIGVAIFALPPSDAAPPEKSTEPLPSSAENATRTARRHSQPMATKPPQSERHSQGKPTSVGKIHVDTRVSADAKRHHQRSASSESETTRTSSRSRLAKFSRLALFGRDKDEPAAEPGLSRQRLRKGPAAGTGHEAHGKFGRRLRKTSTSSSNTTANDSDVSVATTAATTVATTVSHTDSRRHSRISTGGSTRNQMDLDVFAASRMKPVALQGGSLRGRAHPFPLTPINTQHNYPRTGAGETVPSPRRSSTRRERCSSIFDEPSYLAARRSQRLSSVGIDPMTILPARTEIPDDPPQPDSQVSAAPVSSPTTVADMHRVDPALLIKQQKRSRMARWNIFRRHENVPKEKSQTIPKPTLPQHVPVSVSEPIPIRKVPYYALLDPEADPGPATNLGLYLREAAESPDEEQYNEDILRLSAMSSSRPAPHGSSLLSSTPAGHSGVLQTPPRFTITAFEDKSAASVPTIPKPTVYRAPRLASVGRIPKVVASQPRSEKSFNMDDAPSSPAIDVEVVPAEVRKSEERPPRTSAARNGLTRKKGLSDVRKSSQASGAPSIRATDVANQQPEFLRFPGSQASDSAASSTSTSTNNQMAPSVPRVMRAGSTPQTRSMYEDEVWNEYDDFLDDVLTPVRKPKQTAEKGQRSQSRRELLKISTTRAAASEDTVARTPDRKNTSDTHRDASSPIVDTSSSLEENSLEETRLRRSRIAAALHSSYASTDPSSPFSMSDFISDYNRPDSGKYSQRTSGSSGKRVSLPAVSLRESQVELMLPRRYDPTSGVEGARDAQDLSKHSDKAYASLMVARWLSFGRVLVSPAHSAIEAIPERKVLIIDGLDSTDWSVYCAATYQAQRAYVHDLKERRRTRTRQGHRSGSGSSNSSGNIPANHRQAELASFNNKFPFPPHFFHAIVVRFLSAMSDSKLKNIISECRRVLSPGGYLELMILDMDIVNMGIQTRRAIKDLKIKMSAVDRDVSLKPVIDNVSGVLASHGFPSLNRCVIGVPVVGRPRDSIDSSSESRSSQGSFRQRPHGTRGADGQSGGVMTDQLNFSLNDLVADQSENADAEIGRLVSRTARNWWSHCFETSVMEYKMASKSVLASKDVLKECKSRASSFKILIAYTQKPAMDAHNHNRRTMSEPNVPTLAAVGIAR